MGYMVSIKHSAYLLSVIKTNENNKQEHKESCAERTLMLKLSLSATEIQYLSEKTDQNPYSPLFPLNETIACPYGTLSDSQLGEENRKED